jgi:hypothetical protein
MSVPTTRRRPSPLAFGSAVGVLFISSFALAADAPTPSQRLDKAGQQISEALVGLTDLTLDKKADNDHLVKAKGLLLRARAELMQAQGQPAPTE